MRSHQPNRRATKAERILDDALEAARHESPQPASSFAILRSRTEARADTAPEHTIMSTITRPITQHRSLSFGVVLAALVFTLVTLVPFEYQQTVSYNVTYDGFTANAEWTPDQFTSIFHAMGYDDATVRVIPSETGRQCIVTGLPSRHAVREANAMMAAVVGFTGEPSVDPVRETVSGSLYAQVKNELDADADDPQTVFSDLDFKGKTDQEIKDEIRSRLEARGCMDADIRVETVGYKDDGEPKRLVWIKVGNESDADSVMPMGILNFNDLDVNDPTKTDDDIIALVKERLARAGMPDASVEVTRDDYGERQLKITHAKKK